MAVDKKKALIASILSGLAIGGIHYIASTNMWRVTTLQTLQNIYVSAITVISAILIAYFGMTWTVKRRRK